MPKIILDLCGGTGAWSKPYVDAGYEVYVIDMEDILQTNATLIQADIRKVNWEALGKIRGILAAPPCTEFSYAKHFHGKGNYEHDFDAGMSIVNACLRVIRESQPLWWCLENPWGYLRDFLGEPVAVFDPWQYGDKYQKRTCLWGRFNIPEPVIIKKPDDVIKFSMLRSKEIHPEYYGKLTRQKRRSITPSGFAKAYFRANP